MRIRWTTEAATDLETINQYLRAHQPHFAQPTMRKLYDAARSLRTAPFRRRVGREDDTRELLCLPLPYIIAYRVEGENIEILHIHHAARDRP